MWSVLTERSPNLFKTVRSLGGVLLKMYHCVVVLYVCCVVHKTYSRTYKMCGTLHGNYWFTKMDGCGNVHLRMKWKEEIFQLAASALADDNAVNVGFVLLYFVVIEWNVFSLFLTNNKVYRKNPFE